jgi:DNA mismatch repair protein MutS
MLDQYNRIKRNHQGCVLFFRLGDFYEMFAEDALEVSSLLNLTLTNRNGLPMCGIPYHAVQSYVARLLRLGKKIAVCEQVSEPGKTKLLERQVVEIITPGTAVEEDYLDKGSSNYLASLAPAGRVFSFSYIDLSTGSFYAASFSGSSLAFSVGLELERLEIKEIIVAESILEEFSEVAAKLCDRPNLVVNRWADWLFDRDRSRERLLKQFKTTNLRAFGLEDLSPEIVSAGALLDYCDQTAKSLIPHVRSIALYGQGEFVGIDESSQYNLELIKNLRNGTEQYSLLEVLDETKTAMGKRLLKRRLLHPLKKAAPIERRLDLVERFYRDQEELDALRTVLAKTPDLERLLSRLAMDRAHGKDMISIKNALETLGRLKRCVLEKVPQLFESPEALTFSAEDFHKLEEIRSLLGRSLEDNPSTVLTEGNLIRRGFNADLDGLYNLKENGRKLLEDYLQEEKKATGIPSLKIRYNRLIGYFFEVTNVHLSRVPSYFIRRQGIVGGERFSTERLASLESDINSASDRIIALEKHLFLELRETVKEQLDRISAAAKLAGELDAAQSLSWAATIRGWIRPAVDEKKRTYIAEGRHPVVEAHLPGGEFIPNDLDLDEENIFFALITGPNMAGKSTYLRQTALITIMAQIGSFVPAREAVIGLTDRIYCRVGASDNLARGESTFLVEMNETAHILHTATEQSLVIMDEVGRGTGTTDGMAIAWAVCEDLLRRIKCRTLFATHFHELSQMEMPGLANRSMEVMERDGQIIFLRKLKDGPSAESYGLHVAGLAGLPEPVLKRARLILEKIRKKDAGVLGEILPGPFPEEVPPPPGTDPPLTREILNLDTDRITPLEALERICQWKQLLEEKQKTGPVPVKNPGVKPAVPLFSSEKAGTKTRLPVLEDPIPSLFD